MPAWTRRRDTGFDAGGRDARDNPGQWVAATPAFPSTTATLYGVWPLDDGTVWVAGASGSRGIAARFVQGLWAEAVLPSNAPTLFGIWASGPTDVWAVGINGTVLHFDGGPTGLWTTVPISGTQPTATLTGVWGASSADVWIVGQGGLILHGSASGVTAEPSGTTADLAGIWGLSATRRVGGRGAGAGVAAKRDRLGGPDGDARLEHLLRHLARRDERRLDRRRSRDAAQRRRRLDGGHQPARLRDQHLGQRQRRRLVGGPPGHRQARRSSRASTACSGSRRRARATMPLQAVRGTSATNVWAVGNGGTVLRLQVP